MVGGDRRAHLSRSPVDAGHGARVLPAARIRGLRSVPRPDAAVLSEAAVRHDHAFWSDRRVDPSIGIDRPLVDRALQQLRATEQVRLARSAALEIREMPAVGGREIVLERRILSEQDPAGVRYVADVDILALLDIASSREAVPDLFEMS